MPSYNKKDFKDSNVNYLNKDFGQLKQSLINYAKSYFPESYRDFNETSPGMMLLEMNAYVGDVLSFYIDQQYKEMLLPLAEERRNIVNMAKMFGYKVKPIVPAYVDLTFKSEVSSVIGNESQINYGSIQPDASTVSNQASAFLSGIQISSNTNPDIIFETLDVVDFTVTGSTDFTAPAQSTNSSTGLIDSYLLSRKVRAVSGKQKSKTFSITNPTKFLKLTIEDTNVIDIISCVDTNGNNWYEVDFLAQEFVPIETHYGNDDFRNNAYYDIDTSTISTDVAVPYSLQYIRTSKKFTRETNEDNTTSLVFGNGVLKSGETIDDGYLDLEQAGILIPGQTGGLSDSIDPLEGDEFSTLGETPIHTTLTVTYRVGGGISSNVASDDLTSIIGTPVRVSGTGNGSISSVTNETPAVGGMDEETIDEIREKSKAFFATQNRCVTKEDYEARTLNIPSKFGNIAKVYVSRFDVATMGVNNLSTVSDNLTANQNSITLNSNNISLLFGNAVQSFTYEDYQCLEQDVFIPEYQCQGQNDIYFPEFQCTENDIYDEEYQCSEDDILNESFVDCFQQTTETIVTVGVPGCITGEESLPESGTEGCITGDEFFPAEGREGCFQCIEDDVDEEVEGCNSVGDFNIIVGGTEIPGNYTIEPEGYDLIQNQIDILNGNIESLTNTIGTVPTDLPSTNLGTINIFVLSYNSRKQLVGNALAGTPALPDATDNIPLLLLQNIKSYVDNFRILTDDLEIQDGYVINFGVFFDVVAHKFANKNEVKLLCIEKIKEYFNIDKMQFSQPIFVSQLEYELMDVDGVRAVNYVTISQYEDYNSDNAPLPERLYTYSVIGSGDDTQVLTAGEVFDGQTVQGTSGYGYKYDFESALEDGIIIPPHPTNPGVFELKNPNQNIKGVVK